MRTRRAFTLIELLVVIAIVGVLIGLLLPAVQKVREAANRSKCQHQLKQLALAAHGYHNDMETFPPGLDEPSGPASRGASLFVYLLPYLEQDNLYQQWDFGDPSANLDGGTGARAATVLSVLLCPGDRIGQNPLDRGSNRYAAVASYGGNGGKRSFPLNKASVDGIFHMTGPRSKPKPDQLAVWLADVADGTSHTVFFGERLHADSNWDSYLQATFVPPPPDGFAAMASYRSWAPVGPVAITAITMGSWAGVNFMVPSHYDPPTPPKPKKPVPWSTFESSYENRLSAYGSGHPGGANFAFVDGSVRFLRNNLSTQVLEDLCTRNGGEATSTDGL